MNFFAIAPSILFIILLFRHLLLKKQIRNLTRQLQNRSENVSEKMLSISLIDRDLEYLAGEIDRNYTRQRSTVASTLHHEEHLKESIANISHDLRTPLTVILGHLQLLLKSHLSRSRNSVWKISFEKPAT